MAGGTGDAEHFETPRWCVDALLRQDLLPLSGLVLDPGCGEGAIAGRLIAAHGVPAFRVGGIEIDPARAKVAQQRHGFQVDVGDFRLERLIAGKERGYSLIIGNPPFGQSKEFVERALELTAPERGTVAMLLRLNWLASQERHGLLTGRPPDVYVLSHRPSFAATGTCGIGGRSAKAIKGCGWRSVIATDAERVRACPSCGKPVSWNTQDAAEYAWFVWGPGRGGRWARLDGGPPAKEA